MAEITFVKCPDAPDEGPHCWHIIWRASFHQQGQFDGSEQKCCWCSERRPLTTTYTPPTPHGPHAPNNPTGQFVAGLWR
jgi:hypothetical protein